MVLVGKCHDHVAYVPFQDIDVFLVDDFTSDAVVDPEPEVEREGVPVLEDVLDHTPVGRCRHCMEILVISDLIDVGPCGKIYVCVLSE